MPENLFAATRVDGGQFNTKRIPLRASVQQDLEDLFLEQEQNFHKGVLRELPFDGQWKPDEDELLTIDITPEAQPMLETVNSDPLSIEQINVGNFASERIKGLFMGVGQGDSSRILVQKFNAGQLLQKKFALSASGNAFGRLSGANFLLAGSLTCIIESGTIKFKSLQLEVDYGLD